MAAERWVTMISLLQRRVRRVQLPASPYTEPEDREDYEAGCRDGAAGEERQRSSMAYNTGWDWGINQFRVLNLGDRTER